MNQILQGKPLTIFGDGEQTRAFSYIDDVAPTIARSVLVPHAYGQVFNVGGDQPYTVNELVRVTADAFGVTPEVTYLPARNEVKHAFSAHTKSHQFFGPGPCVPLADGVGRMAAWVKRVGSRKTTDFAAIEIARGLPAGW
jgi:UDP-glucose 4-epimerase